MELLFLVPALEVLLVVEQVLDVLVKDVGGGALFLADFIDLVAVEVGLRARVLAVQQAVQRNRVVLGHASINIISWP